MKERSIIMRADDVRAILEGRKTQTRRIVNKPKRSPHFVCWDNGSGLWPFESNDGKTPVAERGRTFPLACPFGEPGDRLWVRETHGITHSHGQHRSDGQRWGPWGGLPMTVSPDGTQVAYYRASFDRSGPPRWRSPIHMPRWASRIALEVVDVRVERLQDITPADAVCEGYQSPPGTRYAQEELAALDWFREQWDAANKPATWATNPWVWAIEFKRVEGQP